MPTSTASREYASDAALPRTLELRLVTGEASRVLALLRTGRRLDGHSRASLQHAADTFAQAAETMSHSSSARPSRSDLALTTAAADALQPSSEGHLQKALRGISDRITEICKSSTIDVEAVRVVDESLIDLHDSLGHSVPINYES